MCSTAATETADLAVLDASFEAERSRQTTNQRRGFRNQGGPMATIAKLFIRPGEDGIGMVAESQNDLVATNLFRQWQEGAKQALAAGATVKDLIDKPIRGPGGFRTKLSSYKETASSRCSAVLILVSTGKTPVGTKAVIQPLEGGFGLETVDFEPVDPAVLKALTEAAWL